MYHLNNDKTFKERTHIREIRDVFTVLNSSVNIVIYNCLGEKFRKFFSNLFNCTGKNPNETSTKFETSGLMDGLSKTNQEK